jgi:hypothetical protein
MSVRTEIRPAPRKTTWWRRPWIAPLALLVGAFLAFSLPPYLAFDPARSRVPQPDGFPAHYWFLVAHILFGTIAIVGVILQIWPWLRRTHPALHRRIGRVYIFGGAIPSALMALSIALSSPFGPAAGVLNVVEEDDPQLRHDHEHPAQPGLRADRVPGTRPALPRHGDAHAGRGDAERHAEPVHAAAVQPVVARPEASQRAMIVRWISDAPS